MLWLLLKSRQASVHLPKAVDVAVTEPWQKPRVAGAQPSNAGLSHNRKWVNLKWQFLLAQQFSKQSFSIEGRLTSSSQQLAGALLAPRPGEGRQPCAWLIAQGLQLEVNYQGGQ